MGLGMVMVIGTGMGMWIGTGVGMVIGTGAGMGMGMVAEPTCSFIFVSIVITRPRRASTSELFAETLKSIRKLLFRLSITVMEMGMEMVMEIGALDMEAHLRCSICLL